MNTLGIIAEFNPLHTGHAYMIKEMRRKTDADFCVIAMSGDYVQRGEPAFFTKELRTRSALLAGSDLVLELPISVSTGSAEYFAQGAVSLLDKLGCITHLGFGSENGDIRVFQHAGKLLCQESETYQKTLQSFLQKGMNFPKARCEALSAVLADSYENDSLQNYLPDQENSSAANDIAEILSLLESPNNILGTEYVKALFQRNSSIIPATIKRAGADYHEKLSDFSKSEPTINHEKKDSEYHSYASASGLRECFTNDPTAPETDALLEKYIPAPCHPLFKDALNSRQYLIFDDLYQMLFHTLQYSNEERLSSFQDVTPELASRILHHFKDAVSCTAFIEKLNAKNYTSARIRRSLLHILLHITKETVSLEKEADFCQYARILGFRKEAEPLLSKIKKHASVPLVSKLADAHSYLSPLACSQLQQTISASELYRAALASASPIKSAKRSSDPLGKAFSELNEYRQEIIIM